MSDIERMVKEIEAEAAELRRRELIRMHGEEKAAEIILARELGELTYVMDGEEQNEESFDSIRCGFGFGDCR